MKIAFLLISLLIILFSFAGYFLFSHDEQKAEEVDEAMSTLGNFAENHQKTAENMATFRDLLSTPKSTEKKPQDGNVK